MYDRHVHRALIAMRCARYHRPFDMVNDEEYRKEVELLRPGTVLPSASNLSRDTQHLHQELSFSLKDYFANYNGVTHLALDGWTSPLVSSYLGIVVIWYDKGKIWRATLDFSRCESDLSIFKSRFLTEFVL